MVYITRKVSFSSSHRLFNPEFSDEKNDMVFDKCNNVHGHNYDLEVTVAGTPDPETGYVIDLKILKDILDRELVSKVDHEHLNDVSFMQGIIPTAENLAIMFWKIIEQHLPKGRLYTVKVFESANNFVEYRGEAVSIKKYQYDYSRETLK